MAKAGVNSYSVKIVAGGASGATSTASLVIDGNVIQTASFDAGTAGDITFKTVDGTNDVVLAYTAATTPANLTAGDTWENTVTVSGIGTAAKGDTLTVSDYRNGMILKPASDITSAHDITLRAATVTTTPGSESIEFDVLVDKQNATKWTIDRTLKDFSVTIGNETLNFKAALGSLDVAKAKKGDEVVYSTVQDAKLVGRYGTKDAIFMDTGKAKSNASVLMEVTSVSDVNESVDFKVTANILNTDGSTTTRVTNLTLNKNDLKLNSTDGDAMNLLGLDLTLSLDLNLSSSEKVSSHYKTGDKLVYNVLPLAAPSNNAVSSVFKVDGQQNAKWNANWIYTDPNDIDPATNLPRVHDDVTVEGTSLLYGVNAKAVNGQEVHLKNFYVNEKDGTVYTGDIVLTLDKEFDTKIKNAQSKDVLASFEAAYVGQVAKGDVKLRDLDKFWNSEGRFLLDDPQKLTISQGNGSTATVTLYATDTLNDAATKLNEAIAKQLGQQSVLHITDGTEDPAAKRFVTFVDDAKEGTSEALAGTFVIRSVVAGTNGQISFAGDEELINKFSLNEIQAAEENSFTASVWDAHTGKAVASSVKVTGNKLIGVVNENVDVVFDPMANIKVQWNEATKSFSLTKDEGSYQTILHLADNTTVFQIGANEGEDMGVNFGDMRAEALGLNSVLVTDRVSAARSVTIIDNAIDKVSMQRAKIGAYQNRLEHTINNLTVAGENLTAAESRIRDTDMAKEMMNFTKLQIMLQAGTSMLAQANQLPQNVLSLLR
jgi:flagellin